MECYHCKQKGHVKFTCLSWYNTGPNKLHKDSHPNYFDRAQKIVSEGSSRPPPQIHRVVSIQKGHPS